MVIDFSKVNIRERPTLILKNVAGKPIGTLGYAMAVSAEIKYNESSVLEFNLPATVEGKSTPYYDDVVGMRTIDLQNVGQFILVNPKESGDGIRQIKSCKAYSLEFEFTFKKITIEKGTYELWNPISPKSTLVGMILEEMPSWSIGKVDSSLIGKYRTFEVNDENIYNFIKSTVQQSYNCIFDFDTYNRKINIIDASTSVPVNPVFISYDNLAKEITVEEDTEGIITRLNVNGADGVTIRNVNPSGTNTIINLDYYMSTGNFDQELIDKYNAWKKTYDDYQLQYYNLSIEYSLRTMQKVTASAELVDLQGELTSLENVQAVTIQAIAQNLQTQKDLDSINAEILAKKSEIAAKEAELSTISAYLESLYDDMKAINRKTNFKDYFSEEEYILLDRFIKDDSISEGSFVYQEVSTYDENDARKTLSTEEVMVSESTINHIINSTGKDIYDLRGGIFKINGFVSGDLVRGALERDASGGFLFTAYLSHGVVNDANYPTACVSIMGSSGEISVSDNSLSLVAPSSYMYLTRNTSEYEKRSVEWDLFDYGEEVLEKMSQPSYMFTVTSANFLHMKDFEAFKNAIALGEKIYTKLDENKTLMPIVIGAKLDWGSPQDLSLEFSDKYISGDSAFRLADLLEQSISLGKNVDLSKFTYSAFIDSGASTQVKDFMMSALDVSKNAIISTKNQAITWGESGIRMRRWADDAHTTYEPHEVWLNNNSIMMTSNSWASAELAIGRFYDSNTGESFGIVAPNIVGTLFAGRFLVIESEKKDGSVSVFRVDANGCVLHNSSFDIISQNNKTQIALDPQFGIVIGDYPVYATEEDDGTVTKTVDTDRAKFWVDTDGNLFFEGTLRATTGEFDGKVTAREGYIGNGTTGWTIQDTYIYNGKESYSSNVAGIYIGTDGISLGDGTHHIRASKTGYLIANNVVLTGDITATSGEIGGCTIVDGTLYVKNANIDGKLTADHIDATDLVVNAANISGKLIARHIDASDLRVQAANIDGKLTASQIEASALKVDAADITGKLSADQIDVNDLIVSGGLTVGEIPTSTSDLYNDSGYTTQSGVVSIINGTVTADYINALNIKVEGTIDAKKFIAENSIVTNGSTFTGGVTITGSDHCNISCNVDLPGGAGISSSGDATFGYLTATGSVSIGGNLTVMGTAFLDCGCGTTSDMNYKHSIESISDIYSAFFDALAPVIYKYNDGTSNRYHVGFIANYVEEAILSAGLTTQDFAGFIRAVETDRDGNEYEKCYLRYEEFIALNTYEIQKLKARVNELENKIALLLSA